MENMTIAKYGEVGQQRKFSFDNDIYEIKKVINDLNIKFEWTWGQIQCPHCKEQIYNKKEHEIFRAEILQKKSGEYLVMVDTLDKRKMVPPKEIKDKILKDYLGI